MSHLFKGNASSRMNKYAACCKKKCPAMCEKSIGLDSGICQTPDADVRLYMTSFGRYFVWCTLQMPFSIGITCHPKPHIGSGLLRPPSDMRPPAIGCFILGRCLRQHRMPRSAADGGKPRVAGVSFSITLDVKRGGVHD